MEETKPISWRTWRIGILQLEIQRRAMEIELDRLMSAGDTQYPQLQEELELMMTKKIADVERSLFAWSGQKKRTPTVWDRVCVWAYEWATKERFRLDKPA